MGYTHYWTIKEDKPITEEQMVRLQTDMLRIERHFVENDLVKLGNGLGQGDDVDYGTGDKIAFNGCEKSGEDYETFWLGVGDTGGEFCKTARKGGAL